MDRAVQVHGDSASYRGFLLRVSGVIKIPFRTSAARHLDGFDGDGDTVAQGLTLVHFTAQLEPGLTHENTLHTRNTPLTRAKQPLRHPLSHEKRSS